MEQRIEVKDSDSLRRSDRVDLMKKGAASVAAAGGSGGKRKDDGDTDVGRDEGLPSPEEPAMQVIVLVSTCISFAVCCHAKKNLLLLLGSILPFSFWADGSICFYMAGFVLTRLSRLHGMTQVSRLLREWTSAAYAACLRLMCSVQYMDKLATSVVVVMRDIYACFKLICSII